MRITAVSLYRPIPMMTSRIPKELPEPRGSKLYSVIASEDAYALPYYIQKIYKERKRRFEQYLAAKRQQVTALQKGDIFALKGFSYSSYLHVAQRHEYVCERWQAYIDFLKRKKKEKENQR